MCGCRIAEVVENDALVAQNDDSFIPCGYSAAIRGRDSVVCAIYRPCVSKHRASRRERSGFHYGCIAHHLCGNCRASFAHAYTSPGNHCVAHDVALPRAANGVQRNSSHWIFVCGHGGFEDSHGFCGGVLSKSCFARHAATVWLWSSAGNRCHVCGNGCKLDCGQPESNYNDVRYNLLGDGFAEHASGLPFAQCNFALPATCDASFRTSRRRRLFLARREHFGNFLRRRGDVRMYTKRRNFTRQSGCGKPTPGDEPLYHRRHVRFRRDWDRCVLDYIHASFVCARCGVGQKGFAAFVAARGAMKKGCKNCSLKFNRKSNGVGLSPVACIISLLGYRNFPEPRFLCGASK